MLIEHQGKRPNVDPSAYVAPTAVVCGDVTIGENTYVAFGAVLTAEGGAVTIGADCIIRENSLIRAASQHPVRIGNSVLVGPHASLNGCTVEDEVFLATGVTIFHAAKIGRGAEVRINGVVHIKTVLPEGAVVPIGWVAVGNPASILPPNEHEKIWAIQEPLNFPLTVYGIDRQGDGSVNMKELTRKVVGALMRHRSDKIL